MKLNHIVVYEGQNFQIRSKNIPSMLYYKKVTTIVCLLDRPYQQNLT
jgi:hypothetical protein